MSTISPSQAHAYVNRWKLVESAQRDLLRAESVETRLRQLSVLMTSRSLFSEDPQREAGIQQVRERWLSIRKELGGLAFEELAVEQASVFDVGGVSVRLPRVEHLLIMKAIANRPQDQQDVAALLEAHPGVEVDVVRRWVREFAQAMSMSGLIDEFERALERRKPS